MGADDEFYGRRLKFKTTLYKLWTEEEIMEKTGSIYTGYKVWIAIDESDRVHILLYSSLGLFDMKLHKSEAEKIDEIVQCYKDENWKKLYEMDKEYVPCYCPECDQIYEHFSSGDVRESDGWYSHTWRKCEKGHTVIISD